MALYNSTVAFNVTRASTKRPLSDDPPATEGGALYNLTFGSSAAPPVNVHLANSLLTNNTAIHDLVNHPQQGAITSSSSGPSFVQNCSFCDNREEIDRLQIVTGIDPLQCPRADRPCALTNLVPLPSSPAIGRGNPRVCAGELVGGIDRRGQPRPPGCTLGAYKSAPQDVLATTPGCQLSRHSQAGGASSFGLVAAALALLPRCRRRAAARWE